jgi:NADH-quinone oxidoreductase subunit A
MNSNYLSLLVMLIIVAALAGIMILLSMPLGPFRRSPVKDEPFECGMKSIGPNRPRFPVNYYTLAILLLVFDIEVAFLMPWAVLLRELGTGAFVEAIVFIGVIAAGFVYLWRNGALETGE